MDLWMFVSGNGYWFLNVFKYFYKLNVEIKWFGM